VIRVGSHFSRLFPLCTSSEAVNRIDDDDVCSPERLRVYTDLVFLDLLRPPHVWHGNYVLMLVKRVLDACIRRVLDACIRRVLDACIRRVLDACIRCVLDACKTRA
jgi:hypothetical protein